VETDIKHEIVVISLELALPKFGGKDSMTLRVSVRIRAIDVALGGLVSCAIVWFAKR
jgi:hypothetical protein